MGFINFAALFGRRTRPNVDQTSAQHRRAEQAGSTSGGADGIGVISEVCQESFESADDRQLRDVINQLLRDVNTLELGGPEETYKLLSDRVHIVLAGVHYSYRRTSAMEKYGVHSYTLVRLHSNTMLRSDIRGVDRVVGTLERITPTKGTTTVPATLNASRELGRKLDHFIVYTQKRAAEKR